jgi:hypothetical protein
MHEVLYLCVDLTLRRVVTWPEAVQAGFARVATNEVPLRLALRRRGA